MRKFFLLAPVILFLWFCGKNVISHVVGIAIDALIGYYVLFLLCQRIIEKRSFNNLDEMLKEFNITGVARVILTSFQDFGEIFNVRHYIIRIFEIFPIQNTQHNKQQKPYIKLDYEKDYKIISQAFIELIKNNKAEHGIIFKDLVEQNFADKWGYFYHNKYIENIVCKINDECLKNHLPMLGILAVYSNQNLTDCFLDYLNSKNIALEGITKGSCIGDMQVQEYISLIKKNVDKYNKVFNKLNDRKISKRSNKSVVI